MSQPSREQYLESKVLTASQPKLHLMLLDGALRFGNQAMGLWNDDQTGEKALEPLERMFDIVEELLQGLASGEGEISTQLAEQYAFVYRELAACRANKDREKLGNSIELLTYQRETWKFANERIESEQAASPAKTNSGMPHFNMDATQSSAGFSLEA